MFNKPFDGARAKVARAHKHFKELIVAQEAYSETQALTVELEVQDNGDTIAFATVKALPDLEHRTIVADILNNFRATLDIAVTQACIIRGQSDPKLLGKTYFGFGGSEKDWRDNLNNRMAGADQVIRDAVESFKPWKEGGNLLVYALSKITASDKHVDLVPVGANPRELVIDNLKATRKDGKPSQFRGKLPKWGSHDRVELFTVKSPAKVEIGGPTILKAAFGFGEVFGLEGKPVIPTLNEMGVMCEQVIKALEIAANNE